MANKVEQMTLYIALGFHPRAVYTHNYLFYNRTIVYHKLKNHLVVYLRFDFFLLQGFTTVVLISMLVSYPSIFIYMKLEANNTA